MLPPAYFIRHGLTDWNAEGRIQGQVDTDINEIGRRQADANGARLAELKRPTVCVTHGGILRVMFRLIEDHSPEAACKGGVPQDRILELRGGRLRWL